MTTTEPSVKGQLMQSEQQLPVDIEVHHVRKLIDKGEDFLLVDCREEHEFEIVRIENAVHIPMAQTTQRQNEFEPFRDKRIIVHCHHGSRSLQVAHWLRSQGFKSAQNMAGGIDAWSIEIDPNLPRY